VKAPLSPTALAALIEHQILRPEASRSEVEKACGEARTYGFRSVCVYGSRVSFVAALLDESAVKVATVVGFPLGAMDADAKRFETEVAVDNGAQEINVLLNIGSLKDGDDAAVLRELRDIVEAADERPVGVILEVPLLTHPEVCRACDVSTEAGAKSVIASRGFNSGAPTTEDIKMLRELVSASFGVVAAGKIEASTALALIEAGASRLGTPEGVVILRRINESGGGLLPDGRGSDAL